MKEPSSEKKYVNFFLEIKQRIKEAQYVALKAVNKELIMLYWDIGKKIVEQQEMYGWGKAIVETLAKDLQKEYPGIRGFSVQNLWYMRQFYLNYREKTKLQPFVGEISWAKNLIIMSKSKDDLETEFYLKMTKKFGWTKDVLIHKIENKSYEKYLLNQTNFDKTIPKKYQNQAVLAVKDEYTFDFLDIGDDHSEKELEASLMEKVRIFLIEMGGYFSYIGNQYRLEDENASIGIIICKSKNRTIVEYALKETKKPIGVSTYKITTELPKQLSKLLPSKEEIIKRLRLLEP